MAVSWIRPTSRWLRRNAERSAYICNLHKIDTWHEVRVAGRQGAHDPTSASLIAQLASLAAAGLWLDKAEAERKS